jgi:hypothetical protein
MLLLEQVLDRVASHLRAVEENVGRPIVVTAARREQGHWVVEYNTRDFVDSGNDLDALLGNTALLIRDDGTIEGDGR